MSEAFTIAAGIAVLVLLAVVIVLFAVVLRMGSHLSALEQRYNKFLKGKDVEDMESIILKRFAEIDSLKKTTFLVKDSLSEINEMEKRSLQKIGVVKYDAFDDMGGNLSFALALLDHENNGLVLNSVHAREGCYTYAKEVVKGESYILLGNEEKEALEIAKNSDNYME